MSDADAIRALYEAQPYPPPDVPRDRSFVLSTAWLDAHRPLGAPISRPGCRVLVAGCGAGHEAHAFAASMPEAEVVGVDFSAAAISQGRAEGGAARLEQGDLTDPALPARLGRFDLILCNAVAEYIPDSAALLAGFAAMLAPHGLVMLAANRDAHPRARVRAALRQLGLPEDPSADRAPLRVLATLMGRDVGIPDLAALPEGLLAVDLFPPFAHDRPLADWAARAEAAGLRLQAGADVASHLAPLPDADLPVLYGLDRAEAALLVDGLRFDPAFGCLLGAATPERVPFGQPDLDRWALHRDPSLAGLPTLAEGWDALRSLGVSARDGEIVHYPVPSPLFGLLASADGRPLATQRARLPDPGPDAAVHAALFRLWHAGLLRLTPP